MKRNPAFFLFLFSVLSLLFILFLIPADADENEFFVILDAGHGGADGGAVSIGGTCEKDLNLDMVCIISEHLSDMGYRTVLTREEDCDTDFSDGFHKRKDILNRLSFVDKYPSSIFVSVHMNSSGSPSDKGFQVFFGRKNEESRRLAEAIHYTVENFAYVSRMREVKRSPDNVYIMLKSPVPSVLVECGFLSNKTDENLLCDKDYRASLGYFIACGIDKYLTEKTAFPKQ